ncbi:MAG: hypothetical protein H6582_08165 [Crocinitomicaceae bacterium]|nr:hypothetical protein [Crocinitomicaceae bacterium]
MRLAQLARKVEVKPAEIRTFIKDKFNVELDKDPNIKIEEEHVKAVMDNFKVEEVVPEVKVEKKAVKKTEKKAEKKTEEKVAKKETKPKAKSVKKEKPVLVKSDDVSVKTSDEEAEVFPKADDVKTNTSDLKEDKKVVSINYEDPTEGKDVVADENTVFEAVEVNRDAELIAAKVEKLQGLKVVGKIDLGTDEPEPEEEDLPTIDAIENEIDALDGDVDTSEFPDMNGAQEMSDEKAAIFAELDAAMDNPSDQKVKKVANTAAEVKENIEEEEEDSIYKNDRGEYRFTPEQKRNREISLANKAKRERDERMKKNKAQHYQQNVAAKVQTPVKKKKAVKTEKKKAASKEEPKGAWKKFLRWLND